MPQPFMVILAHQTEMSAKARKRLKDVNEAGLVVNAVLGRALRKARVRLDVAFEADLWRDFEETLDRSRLS